MSEEQAQPRGLMYIRVSTKRQAEKDGQPEGYSLPAQRGDLARKAEGMGVEIVEEYVDRGESAKSTNRPALQAMLERIATERDVQYVFVHQISRLARNRLDDLEIGLFLQKYGVTLVSYSEPIDETPTGKLVHGIMA